MYEGDYGKNERKTFWDMDDHSWWMIYRENSVVYEGRRWRYQKLQKDKENTCEHKPLTGREYVLHLQELRQVRFWSKEDY